MDNIKKHLERLDEIKSVCSVNGWWNVDTLAIPEKVYRDTEEIIPIIPKLFEMSGCPDKSIQFEFSENRRNDFWVIIEI